MYKIFNEDCLETMKNHIEEKSIDIILTSPPYNITDRNKVGNIDYSMKNKQGMYIDYKDYKSVEEYSDFITERFLLFDRILKENGVILYNVSYGTNTFTSMNSLYYSLYNIIVKTPFNLFDKIIWKKKCALPNNVSPNKLTRICEDIFVIARKDEKDSFIMNKEISCVGKNGQKFYKPLYNYIEAENNDESCSLNNATYSSDLCCKLLNLYGKEGMTVYDPFLGTGTTLVATEKLKMNGIDSEISAKQCEYAEKRLSNIVNDDISELF